MSDLIIRGIGMLPRLPRRQERAPVLAQFRDAMTRETLLTERLRIKAVIITVLLLLGVATVLSLVAPGLVERIEHGGFNLGRLYALLLPFVAFEFLVLYLLARRLRMHLDVPWFRRYLSALIETSMPTFLLHQHMTWMGPSQALGFCRAAGLFPVHYPLDAAAGFLAVDLYGLRCCGRTVGHGDAVSSRRLRR